MTTDYNINNIDLDDSPYNFASYIKANDVNYTNASVLDVTSRKTVIFGQNALTNVHPIGNLGNVFNTAQSINIPKIDIDEVSVLTALPNAIIFSDTKKSKNYIRGNFALLENNPNVEQTLLITHRYSPIQILNSNFNSWTEISSSWWHNSALNSTDQNNLNLGFWTWGHNFSGQLGLNTSLNYISILNRNSYLPYWKKISCGYYFSLGLASNGTLWAWGANDFGQLGISTSITTNRSTPVQIGTGSLWTNMVASKQSSFAIQSNGTLWAWGRNIYGVLGTSDTTNRSTPVQIGNSSWKEISSRGYCVLAIQSNGTLWAWGTNGFGQLGLSDQIDRSSPTQVGNLSNWSKVACGYTFAFALQSNGTLWACGYNGTGQLGQSNTTDRSSPVQVGNLSVWTQIVPGQNHAMAIQSNGTLWAWAYNLYGQLGLSDISHRSSPTQVGNLSVWTRVACGYSHTLAIQSDGTLWAWGNNSYSQLGLVIDYTAPYSKITYGL